MKKTIRICLSAVVLIALIIVAVWLGVNKSSQHYVFSIVATNFPGYDFARTATEGIDGISVQMLLPPGADLHAYEPTPGDVQKIADANLFIYGGGESETWVDEILSTMDKKTIKMTSLVALETEETPPGSAENPAAQSDYDEHVWTSFDNASTIVSAISDALASDLPEYKEKITQNAENFKTSANELKNKFLNLVNSAKRQAIVFGDKFPLRYFADEMGLDYYAAFPGCADETEASPRTISNLVDIIRQQGIPVVFKIELSSGDIAETIARETGAKVLTFDTMHNISQDDFTNGENFLSLMERNFPRLEEALNQ